MVKATHDFHAWGKIWTGHTAQRCLCGHLLLGTERVCEPKNGLRSQWAL